MNNKNQIKELLYRYASSFEHVLYEVDEAFIKGMERSNLAGDDIEKYKFWEWIRALDCTDFGRYIKVREREIPQDTSELL